MKKLYILPLLFGLLFSSCEDYLNVGSETDLTQDQIYSTDEGFHKALTGVYIGMGSENLYGSQLTWRMVEHFAQHYEYKSSGSDAQFYSYNFTHSTVASTIEGVWNGLYNLIYRCNDILTNLEERKSEVNPINYQMVKGEALALRAFFHFDLLRLFGHGDYRNRSTELSGKHTIPYVTTVGKEITKQATYAEVFRNLKADLTEATQLLWGKDGENCSLTKKGLDNLNIAAGNTTNFYTCTDVDSKPRINYYAAKAILARVLMWEGSDEGYQAILDFLENEWEPQGNNQGYKAWRWISASRLTDNYVDRIMTEENFWYLQGSGLNDIIGEWFTYRSTDPNNVFMLTPTVYKDIFEYNTIGFGDGRAVYQYTIGTGTSNYEILKLNQYDGDKVFYYKNMIPLISTAELYYMAAEIYLERGESDNALAKLNEVRRHRGLTTDLMELDNDAIKNEILKEWRKEYIALGQLFFLYKRWNLDTVGSTTMTDEQYVLPFPENETLTGNREQFITEKE
jgi:hypothetical protein